MKWFALLGTVLFLGVAVALEMAYQKNLALLLLEKI